jgi:hypothetical protein
MDAQLFKSTLVAGALAAAIAAGLLPTRVVAQDHPQEVLDLIAEHQALAMKIRPLQDRIVVARAAAENSERFKPEGVPLRASSDAATGDGSTAAESRISGTLRHKDRAATSGDDLGRISARLSALERQAMAERERINRPRFGLATAQSSREGGDVRFGDGRRGTRPAPGSKSQEKPVAGVSEAIDAQQIGDARKALVALQREVAALEREVNALERR